MSKKGLLRCKKEFDNYDWFLSAEGNAPRNGHLATWQDQGVCNEIPWER